MSKPIFTPEVEASIRQRIASASEDKDFHAIIYDCPPLTGHAWHLCMSEILTGDILGGSIGLWMNASPEVKRKALLQALRLQ